MRYQTAPRPVCPPGYRDDASTATGDGARPSLPSGTRSATRPSGTRWRGWSGVCGAGIAMIGSREGPGRRDLPDRATVEQAESRLETLAARVSDPDRHDEGLTVAVLDIEPHRRAGANEERPAPIRVVEGVLQLRLLVAVALESDLEPEHLAHLAPVDLRDFSQARSGLLRVFATRDPREHFAHGKACLGRRGFLSADSWDELGRQSRDSADDRDQGRAYLERPDSRPDVPRSPVVVECIGADGNERGARRDGEGDPAEPPSLITLNRAADAEHLADRRTVVRAGARGLVCLGRAGSQRGVAPGGAAGRYRRRLGLGSRLGAGPRIGLRLGAGPSIRVGRRARPVGRSGVDHGVRVDDRVALLRGGGSA